jgi:NADH:ubiquinone oxidoreductase subunit H
MPRWETGGFFMRGAKLSIFLLAAVMAFVSAIVTFSVLPTDDDMHVGGKTLILTGMIAVGLGFAYMAWQARKSN